MGLPLCGYSLVVKFQPSKLARRVRFPLPAPLLVNILQNDETPAVCAGALRKQHAKPFPELEEKYAELLPPRKVCMCESWSSTCFRRVYLFLEDFDDVDLTGLPTQNGGF